MIRAECVMARSSYCTVYGVMLMGSTSLHGSKHENERPPLGLATTQTRHSRHGLTLQVSRGAWTHLACRLVSNSDCAKLHPVPPHDLWYPRPQLRRCDPSRGHLPSPTPSPAPRAICSSMWLTCGGSCDASRALGGARNVRTLRRRAFAVFGRTVAPLRALSS